MTPDNPLATLFQTFTAYQRTGALKGAVELDLFTAVAEGNETAAALAARCQAAERGVRILCDTLTALGFLHKHDGRYALDPVLGPFLDRRFQCAGSVKRGEGGEDLRRVRHRRNVVRAHGIAPPRGYAMRLYVHARTLTMGARAIQASGRP